MVSAWVMAAPQWSPAKEKKFQAAIASVYSRPHLQNLPTLKPYQVDVLRQMIQQTTTFIDAPTGYGKSLIYFLFPFVLERFEAERHARIQQACIVVVTPFLALMNDQMQAAESKWGIKSRKLISEEWKNGKNIAERFNVYIKSELDKGTTTFFMCPEGFVESGLGEFLAPSSDSLLAQVL